MYVAYQNLTGSSLVGAGSASPRLAPWEASLEAGSVPRSRFGGEECSGQAVGESPSFVPSPRLPIGDTRLQGTALQLGRSLSFHSF